MTQTNNCTQLWSLQFPFSLTVAVVPVRDLLALYPPHLLPNTETHSNIHEGDTRTQLGQVYVHLYSGHRTDLRCAFRGEQ